MLNTFELVLGLLVAVAFLALVSRKLPIPYPVMLVLGGLALALTPGLPHLQLSPELVFLIFLPPLLYPAALFMPWRDFRANLRPISLLAVGLVLFTTIAVGYFMHYALPNFPLAAGFVLGAIISPPDAIAATAIAEHVPIPRRLVTILEGESLVNDATALVTLRFALAAAATGAFSLGQASFQFAIVCLGGILAGLVVGLVTVWVQKQIDDPPIEITLSLLTPFAAYLPAEQLHCSGVLAVVTAGLYHGWRNPEIMTSRTRLRAGPVWEMVEFLLNGFIFLMIGLQLPQVVRALSHRALILLVRDAGLLSAAVIVIRIIWVFPAAYLPRWLFKSIRDREPCPRWRHVGVVAWTGMRGVVSLAAAMSLPITLGDNKQFPGRELILFFTFSVILATLVLQGLTLPVLIHWLGVHDDGLSEKEERNARLKANQAALARLDEIGETKELDPDILHRLRAEYEDRIRQLEISEPGHEGHKGLFSSEYERLSHQLLQTERHTLLRLRNERTINDATLRRIQRDIDLAEARLKSSG